MEKHYTLHLYYEWLYVCTDVALPAPARGDRTHHHVPRALAREPMQGSTRAPHRLRARIHEHKPRGFHRIRQVCLTIIYVK